MNNVSYMLLIIWVYNNLEKKNRKKINNLKIGGNEWL